MKMLKPNEIKYTFEKCKHCKVNVVTNLTNLLCDICIDKYDIRLGEQPKFEPTNRVNVYGTNPLIYEMYTDDSLYLSEVGKGTIKSVNSKEKYAIVKLDNHKTETFIVPFEQMKKLKKKSKNKYIWVKFYNGNTVIEYATMNYNPELHKDWVKFKKVS